MAEELLAAAASKQNQLRSKYADGLWHYGGVSCLSKSLMYAYLQERAASGRVLLRDDDITGTLLAIVTSEESGHQ